MKAIATCILLAVLPCKAVHADLITILLGKHVMDKAVDGVPSGSITFDELTLTLVANDGILNATSASYGVNAEASGDATALLDGGSGIAEQIAISFNRPVEFTQLTLGQYGSSEVGLLTLGVNQPLTLLSTGTGANVFDFTAASFPLGNFLAPGQTAIISYVSGNGFSLDGLQVNTVPEPAIFGLSALAMAALVLTRRQRRCATRQSPNRSAVGEVRPDSRRTAPQLVQ